MKICYQIYLKGLFLVLFLNTSYAQTPAPPNGKTWERVEKLSDEFNGSILDQNKWDDYHPHWSGRPPSRFKKGNAFVEGGYLKLRSTLLKNPNAVNNPLSDIWVNSAACVSKGWDAKPGYYYEARFKASSLSMTSSFWFRVGKFSEIDVIEHIGNPSRENRQDDLPYQYHANTHYYGPHQGKPNKAAEWRMPSRGRDGFHTYGFWWKSPTELLFYYDGREVMKIVPRVPLNENLKMIFDTEVFPFAQAGVPNIGLPKVENLNNNAKNTMLVDWVRTYKLVDGNSNGENTPPSVSFSNIQNNAQFPVGYSLKPEVNASDNDGIANVRLYMNDEFVRQENARPYQWGIRDDIDGILKNLKQGKYILKAIAKDKRGAETIKSITVNIGSNGNGNTQLITNGVYFITSNQSNQRLLSRAQENFSAIMHDPLNFNDQRWEFKHLGDNIYTIQNFGNKRFLEVPNATCFNGSNVATWANEIGNHKKWKIISNGSGLYAIKPLHCQARGLDRKNGAKNTNIQIWDFGIDNANQKWKIIRDQNRSFPEESQVIDAEGIILYPNPAKDIVFLSGLRVEDLIKIYNIQGKVVFTTKAKSEDEVISMAKFETGIYIIKINGNQIHKLIKE